MAHILDTLITALLPPIRTVRFTQVTVEQDTIQLQLTATAPTACCPSCAIPSSSVHIHYQRHLTDLPWGTRSVRPQLTVRKFVCRNLTCARRIFTERFPDFVAPSARKTTRLVTLRRAIGLALGGQAGARLAARLRLPTSPATLLRLVRVAPVPHTLALRAVGVDEWAWRRGNRYGTILVDLMTHRVIDLLPDRSAATVAAWLAQHPTITAVCRDRSDLYADGIRQGAPDAVLVVGELARFARGLQGQPRGDCGADPAVEQRRHRGPDPSPETGEASGLRAGRVRPPPTARPPGGPGMEMGSPGCGGICPTQPTGPRVRN
jgi:transposase